ncbi:MAG: DNA primase [Chitinophagia bacterium]|jgi:DNA primase
MISPETIQQITSRIDIIDVVGEFVKLKKRGSNYMGLCPFHNEKSPSFTVSPSKEIYKCFGCGKSGNAIGFVMEHEKIGYPDALRWLANRYNITIEETAVSAEQQQRIQTSDSLYIINQFAQKFYSRALMESDEGKAVALSYLFERGFREPIIEKFQIGYHPDQKDVLSKALLENQFSKELIVKTGLSVLRSESLIDNYRGRIIFPIHGITGKIVGFGARIIGKASSGPKYINTPENEVYSKSKLLYGMYFAKTAIDKADECLLVEGYTDVVSLHQAGIENVVASGGTSLTVDQLRLIRKYTPNITIIYDGDQAGIKAALRGLDLALEEGLQVKLVLIPDGEDPDSYVNKVGATEFRNFIQTNKKDFILFQLEVMLQEAGSDVNQKSIVVNHIAETLSRLNKLEDFTRQQDYVRQCAAILKIDEGGLTSLVNKYKREKLSKEDKKMGINEQGSIEAIGQQPPPPPDADSTLDLLAPDELPEKNIIRVLLLYGLQPWDVQTSVAQYIFSELLDFQFDIPLMEKFFNEYQQQFHQGLEPGISSFMYHEDEEIRKHTLEIATIPFELSTRWNEYLESRHNIHTPNSKGDVEQSVNYFKLRKVKKMIEENQRDLETAAPEKLKQILEIHKHLKQLEISITKQMGAVIVK